MKDNIIRVNGELVITLDNQTGGINNFLHPEISKKVFRARLGRWIADDSSPKRYTVKEVCTKTSLRQGVLLRPVCKKTQRYQDTCAEHSSWERIRNQVVRTWRMP